MWKRKCKIMFTVTVLIGIFLLSALPVSAIEEPSDGSQNIQSQTEESSSQYNDIQESSVFESSVSESTYNEELSEQSYYEEPENTESYDEESYYSESSYEESTYNEETYDNDDSQDESMVEESYESSAEEISEESEISEYSDTFSDTLGIDPFDFTYSLDTVIPAEREDYISPKQESENKLAEESLKAAAAALLSSPPMPYEEITNNPIANAKKNDTEGSFLTGIIIWSIIGIIVTSTLIIIFNSKGGKKIRRNRYKSTSITRMNGKKNKSKYIK